MKSESLNPTTLFSFSKLFLAIPGPLDFYINVRAGLFISTKKKKKVPVGILIKFALNLTFDLGKSDILKILSFPIHTHDIFLYLGPFEARQ